MPNEYSIEIHNHISEMVAGSKEQLNTAQQASDSKNEAYQRGRLDELNWLRSYLAEHVDLKDFKYY